MICCLAKSDRASRLFSELVQLDGDYVDQGVIRPAKIAQLLGAASSFRLDFKRIRTDAFFSPIVRRELERQCKAAIETREGLSAVLYWGAVNSPVAMLEKKLPYFIVTDGPYDPSDPTYPIEWKPARWSEEYFARQREIYTGAAHVFTLSEWARQKIIALHNLPGDKVTRIGWGPIHVAGAPRFTPAEKPYFLSLGNEWHRKGMDVVAAAGALLHQSHPEYSTLIVGDPKGFSVKPAPGVTLRPQAVSGSEAQTLIAGARALLVASRFDASPHVIYEALQVGTPVIATSCCGITEAIPVPQAGRVVPSENAAALAEAMEAILQGPEVDQRKAAHSVYEDSGGWAACAKKVHSLISQSLLEHAVSA